MVSPLRSLNSWFPTEGDLGKLLMLSLIDQHRSFGRRLAIVAGVAEGEGSLGHRRISYGMTKL